MSYTALYRKFRPDNFDDVKGQDHIVTTLTNQIKHNRIGHAYLFCGTRGTGKTTVAKILAKAVNCQHPVNGSPCGECDMCKAIQAGCQICLSSPLRMWLPPARNDMLIPGLLPGRCIKYPGSAQFVYFSTYS